VAQERNEITQGSNETAEIKSEIERTRVEMSETLGEIQERLRPDHLIQQAKDTVTEAATGKVRNIMYSAGETATMVADQTKYAGRNVADYVRNHPVQVAMLAGGVTWWLLRGRDRSDDWEGASEGWQDGQGYSEGYSIDEERPLTAKVGEYASAAKETVGEYASSARETVGEYAASAGATARRASSSVRSAARNASASARQGWQTASTSVDDWVHEYPLAAGAVAVAVGVAIGLSAPSTEWEDRTLGEKRDLALERARLAARDIKENVSQKVQDVADSVIDVANSATSSTTPSQTTTASPSTTGSL
jgi:ElaB/YqjD/DUF883 family membrane-anchored ribosome-binding protein